MAGVLSALAQLAGLGLVAAGLFMLAPWLGVVAAGIALFVLGYLTEGTTDGAT